MALKNQANLDTARTVAQEKFDEVFNTIAAGQSSLFTDTYSTGSETDELVFVTFLNTVREWLGAKEYGNFEAFKQSISLTTYEDSFGLSRRLVDYDSSGAATGRAIQQKIVSARQNSDDKLVFDSLVSNSGGGPTGFDGVSLINDSHSLGGSTYDNKTTSALSVSTFNDAIVAMQGFKAANGEPLNIFPTTLVVGPKLRKLAFDIAQNAERVAAVDASGDEGGTSIAAATIPNVFRGDNIDVIVSPRLTGTYDDYWYLMDLSKTDKPMLMKSEREWELIDKTDMRDDDRFNKDMYVWSIEADKKVAAGAWPLIYGGIVS